jgi:two-component system cell cycle sensor histidine kinase/response regulator CckA
MSTPAIYHNSAFENGATLERWFDSFGALLGKSGRGVLLTDNQGTICRSNERLSEIVGYSAEELRGSNPRMFQSGQTNSGTYSELWNAISTGKSWRGVLQNRRKNNQTFVEQITISPVVDARGGITHYFGEVLELTPSSNVLPEWNSEAYVERTVAISNGIAHELNNVLTGIIGTCSLARHRGEAVGAVAGRLETIDGLAHRLHSFSNRLCLCAGHPPLHPETLEINGLIVDALDRLALYTDLEIVMTYLSAEPLYVVGARENLDRAIAELVLNAIEAHRETQQDVVVAVRKAIWEGQTVSHGVRSYDFGLTPGEVIEVAVIDRGPGMEDALMQCAPELFYSTKQGHTGLGLPLVIGLARSLRGAFELHSVSGAGTTARLYLPLR